MYAPPRCTLKTFPGHPNPLQVARVARARCTGLCPRPAPPTPPALHPLQPLPPPTRPRKPHQSQDLQTSPRSGGSALTSCILSQTVYYCLCVPNTVARCGTCCGCHCLQ